MESERYPKGLEFAEGSLTPNPPEPSMNAQKKILLVSKMDQTNIMRMSFPSMLRTAREHKEELRAFWGREIYEGNDDGPCWHAPFGGILGFSLLVIFFVVLFVYTAVVLTRAYLARPDLWPLFFFLAIISIIAGPLGCIAALAVCWTLKR